MLIDQQMSLRGMMGCVSIVIPLVWRVLDLEIHSACTVRKGNSYWSQNVWDHVRMATLQCEDDAYLVPMAVTLVLLIESVTLAQQSSIYTTITALLHALLGK